MKAVVAEEPLERRAGVLQMPFGVDDDDEVAGAVVRAAVDGEDAREVGAGDQAAGVELIERRRGVGERPTLDQQLVRLVAEQPAERDRHQHAEQRQVEEQVARLPEVSLLRGDPGLVGFVRTAEREGKKVLTRAARLTGVALAADILLLLRC